MMIGDLVKGRGKSAIVLIEDCGDEPGRGLLACFLLALCPRVDEVHLIAVETKARSMMDVAAAAMKSNVIIHSCQEDFLNWKQSAGLHLHSDIVQEVKTKQNLQSDRKVAIVVDSLSALLHFRPVSYTCQTLHRLADTAGVEQLVALVHQDLHDNASLTLVEHTAATVIQTSPSRSAAHQFSCNTLHKKISGKITRLEEHFNINDRFEICDVTELSAGSVTSSQPPTHQADPASNLTFNLSLTEEERKARSQVKLPYVYDQDRKDATLSKSVGEGKIFYQPDETDDFNEEDPDDDLDF